MNDFRKIPSVDRILSEPSIKALLDSYSHDSVVKLVQQNVENLRKDIKLGKQIISFKQLINNIEISMSQNWLIQPSPVINASGVILHTNLGRSPLSNESIEAIVNSAGAYTDLEYEPKTGKRGNRQRHVQNLIKHITGSESALVVNNNAAAALLSLTGLDFITSISGAATSISNVGPGLGSVIGPNGNFSSLPDISKWILTLGMILGRLELFAILVLFLPSFWRN